MKVLAYTRCSYEGCKFSDKNVVDIPRDSVKEMDYLSDFIKAMEYEARLELNKIYTNECPICGSNLKHMF